MDVFGDYFLYYVVAHGYDKMLKTLGDTFESFIQNLDSLHSMLALTYTQLRPPSFRSVDFFLNAFTEFAHKDICH